MNKLTCFVCFDVSSYVSNIINKSLLSLYEKLTDLKVQSHYLCFICHRRLQQCYQLQQLAIKQKCGGFYENRYKKQDWYEPHPQNPLITLSVSKMLNVSIPSKSGNIRLNVKQEVNEEDGSIVDEQSVDNMKLNVKEEVNEYDAGIPETHPEQNNLDYFEEQKIKIKDEPSLIPSLQNSVTNGDLIIHKRTHTGEKPYNCDVCYKTVSRHRDLIRHKKLHTDAKPYNCGVCHKTFSRSSDLIIHKRTHTGEKPYECHDCNKTFSQSSHLIRHKRTHTGEKPYKCDMCNKTFSQSNNLIIHKRIHTGEKPYKCDICNNTFSSGSELIRHKKTHTLEK